MELKKKKEEIELPINRKNIVYKIEKGKQKSVYKRGEKRKRIVYKKEEGK